MELNTARYEDYSLFYKFFVTYAEGDFKRVDPNDPIVQELDIYMDQNRQLFYITDVIQLDIKYISKGVKSFFGIDPDKVTTGFFLTTTHSDDLNRHHLARAKLISEAQEIFIRKSGTCIISTNFRGRIPGSDEYADYLYQCFLFLQ